MLSRYVRFHHVYVVVKLRPRLTPGLGTAHLERCPLLTTNLRLCSPTDVALHKNSPVNSGLQYAFHLST